MLPNYHRCLLSFLATALPLLAQNVTSTEPPPPSITATEVIDQSPPFRLQIHSNNQTLNGSFLSPLHEGAALEALGVYTPALPTSYNTFHHNTTRFICTFSNGTITPCSPLTNPAPPFIGQPGLLTWDLPLGGPSLNTTSYAPQLMRLTPRGFSSNMNFPMIAFAGGDYLGPETYVAFDGEGCMNLQDYLEPPGSGLGAEGSARAYYRWWMCYTYGWTGSYVWEHLIWVSGPGGPDWPGCSKVDVKRVWA